MGYLATAAAVAVTLVETTAAAAEGNEERERDAASVAAVEDAAAEMEERSEARFGKTQAKEAEYPEVPRWCERAMMRIFLPCPFGLEKNRVLF